jgi:hypothetical protein
MATWIVHLRLAENLLTFVDGFDPAYLAIGSVAPDSGTPDENWENFDPPPEILHFHAPAGAPYPLSDLDFYRQHLQPSKGKKVDPEQYSFLWGYFSHLVTDNLWNARIGVVTEAKFATEFEADPKFIWQVKRDWYGLDFEYVRNHPDSLYWKVFLGCSYERDYLPFLPPAAIAQRLAYIQELYQRQDERVEEWYIQRPDLYLSQGEMEAFVEESTTILCSLYRQLWQAEAELKGASSALELFPE